MAAILGREVGMELVNIIGSIAAVVAATFSGINVYRSTCGDKPFVNIDAMGSVSVYNSNPYPIVIESVYVTGCHMIEDVGRDENFEPIYNPVDANKKENNIVVKANSESPAYMRVDVKTSNRLLAIAHRKSFFNKDRFDIEVKAV